ncbi:MAG: DUF721 domain-containing protein [Actinomycetota bacterium]|nr:DUF721 domain-containing protein [Actinomycetota bacterium]
MRDRRGRSTPPKKIGAALDRALESVAPRTVLAGVQAAWPAAVGPQIAAVTRVVEEYEGTVTIECESSVWAHELEMMAPQLLQKIAAQTGSQAPEKLRFRASG